MVRVLSCYHFKGQRIGRCEEAAAVTVAGQYVVVGIEDSISVYTAGQGHISEENEENIINHNIPDLGAPITFENEGRVDSACSEPYQSGSCSSSVSSIESDTEIKLSHSFATMDLINSMLYNKKGNYLLCLEGRDDGGSSRNCSIRVYFHWNKKSDVLQMRTRIAGVSPSSNDLEKSCLMMVEIPLTSPAVAVSSCNLTGHLASLSAESVVNIFCYRHKEVSGRAKLHYPDFDRLCAVEIPGFSPDSLSFAGNFVSCTGPGKVHVFQLHKTDKAWSPSLVAANKYGLLKSKPVNPSSTTSSSDTTKNGDKSKQNFDHSNKVTYDPNDDSVTVHLPSITRANRKRAGNSSVVEEYFGEILSNRSRIIFSSAMSNVDIKDVLRITIPQNSGNNNVAPDGFTGTGLYPIRVKDNLGSIACIIGMSKEALVYHLPTKEACRPVRVTNYSFTAPLVTFTFDSLFFHALTESGLETYTSRSLCYALQDQEGLERFRNACPLLNERPCLVGIRPFVRVRYMAANDSLICLLTCPTPVETTASQPKSSPPVSPSALLQDERLWTIYCLELPDIDMLFEDTMRIATTHESQSDAYLTLLSELHLILRTCINNCPEDSPYYMPRYKNLCKSIGLEYLKLSWTVKTSAESKEGLTTAFQNQLGQPLTCEGMLELGVTYLCMAELTVKDIFSSENSSFTSDPKYIDGTVMLINILLSAYGSKEVDKNIFSPSLSTAIVDFLAKYSPETLVELVIKVPILRENQSTRLVEIVGDYANLKGYAGKETVALILTQIALGGVESNVRTQVESVLKNVSVEELVNNMSLEFILDRSPKHATLTDVAICLIAVNSEIPATIISTAMRNHEILVSEVMLAFAKAVNLNSESQIQRSLAKALRIVLEEYLSSIINGFEEGTQINEAFSPNKRSINFSEDDRHATLAVVRSYISDITLTPTNKLFQVSTPDSSSAAKIPEPTSDQPDSLEMNDGDTEEKAKNETCHVELESVDKMDTGIITRNQIFGKIPSFVNFLLSIDRPGGSITPASMTFCPSMFSSNESMDSYIRLLSLLSSHCGKVEGVKDSVLTFVYNNSSSVKATPLQLILQMFCEPVETAISIMISRQPTSVLLYAKEMFGKSTPKWKILVTQLKKRINLNPDSLDSDMFSTIIESVYLHLANTLTLAELEEVLEKGSEDVAKFRSTCKRVELANTYASMVIQISTDYLQNHK